MALSERDRLCLTCPLSYCNERSLGCPWQQYQDRVRQAQLSPRWEWLRRQVREEMGTGEVREFDFEDKRTLRCAQSAVHREARCTDSKVQTWEQLLGGECRRLYVKRIG